MCNFFIYCRAKIGNKIRNRKFIRQNPSYKLYMTLQMKAMGDALGQFLLIVTHHDKGFVRTTTKRFYNLLHQLSVRSIKAMQGFVKDEQLRVFDKCTRQKTKALLATGEGEKITTAQVGNAKNRHPPFTPLSVQALSDGIALPNREVPMPRCQWPEGSSDKPGASREKHNRCVSLSPRCSRPCPADDQKG